MSKSEVRYLGEPVFCVARTGEVFRTAVSGLSVDREQPYKLMNEVHGANFFSLDRAVAQAGDMVKAYLKRGDITKDQESAAQDRLALLKNSKVFKARVLRQPLVQTGHVLVGKNKVFDKDPVFPKDYFGPGQRVYGLVTPSTHYSMSPNWRPHPYFILETRIREVSIAPSWPGGVFYRFLNSHYNFGHNTLFADEVEARRQMAILFAKETGGTIKPDKIKVIKVAVEKKWTDDYTNSLIKRMGT